MRDEQPLPLPLPLHRFAHAGAGISSFHGPAPRPRPGRHLRAPFAAGPSAAAAARPGRRRLFHGEILQPGGQRILDELGVLSAARARGARPLDGFQVLKGGGPGTTRLRSAAAALTRFRLGERLTHPPHRPRRRRRRHRTHRPVRRRPPNTPHLTPPPTWGRTARPAQPPAGAAGPPVT